MNSVDHLQHLYTYGKFKARFTKIGSYFEFGVVENGAHLLDLKVFCRYRCKKMFWSSRERSLRSLPDVRPPEVGTKRRSEAHHSAEARDPSSVRSPRHGSRPRGERLVDTLVGRSHLGVNENFTFYRFTRKSIYAYFSEARSLLYRRRHVHVNGRWQALAEIYMIDILLRRSDLKISATFVKRFVSSVDLKRYL